MQWKMHKAKQTHVYENNLRNNSNNASIETIKSLNNNKAQI